MAVTDEDVKQAKRDALNKKNQERMEGEVYPPTKPEKAAEPTKLPGKPEKKKFGEGTTNYKKGGYVRAADGIAQRGKTKGRMV